MDQFIPHTGNLSPLNFWVLLPESIINIFSSLAEDLKIPQHCILDQGITKEGSLI